MAEEEPTEQEAHPVAKSTNRKNVVRGLIVLIVAVFIAAAAINFGWMIGLFP